MPSPDQTLVHDCPQCGAPIIRAETPPAPLPPVPPALRSVAPPEETLSEPNPEIASVPPPIPVAPPKADPVPPRSRKPTPTGFPTITGYDVLSELGRGGTGVVYKAKQKGLNRLVALKVVLGGAHAGSNRLARFRAEAAAVARLRHPNIVQIYEVGEEDGSPFFSLEFVAGGSLADKFAGKPLDAREAAKLLATVARAVHAAHVAGIVHRDLKPRNILLTPTGDPKIADFGLAKHLDAEGNQPLATDSLYGTPAYAAPEQAAGRHRAVGPATDVYALGVILYELLTGRPPFQGDTPLSTLQMVTSPEPAPPLGGKFKAPRDLAVICMKCLEKSIAQRYPSALDVADELTRFLKGEPIRARPPNVLQRTTRWCRRNPIPASLLFAGALGGAFGLWYLAQLSDTMVRNTALEGARHETEMLDTVNRFYSSEIVAKVRKSKEELLNAQPELKGKVMEAGPDYSGHANVIPIPATLTIDLAKRITSDSKLGVDVRMYSDYPFPRRQEERAKNPPDQFEKEALESLRKNPSDPFYRFETSGGKTVLRYATARRMEATCLGCHNDPNNGVGKNDWEVGDVRGVLEIIRPLDRELNQSSDNVRTGLALIVGIGTTLLVLGVGLVFITQDQLEPAPNAERGTRNENPK